MHRNRVLFGQVFLSAAHSASVMHASGPFSPLPKKTLAGKALVSKVIACVITVSLSPEVITTPTGIPPADVQVLIMNVGQLYLSKVLVESQ